MGAWGTGFFDNDEAYELCDLLTLQGIRALRTVLRIVTTEPSSRRLDEDHASQALAAAAIIGHLAGLRIKGIPDDTREFLDYTRVYPSRSDMLLAHRALQRLLNHSWLEQAWSSSDRKKWRQQVRHLMARLEKLTKPALKSLHPRDKPKGVKKASITTPNRITLQEGDIILIPISINEYVVAKMLFVSKIFKHCILLGVTDMVTRSLMMPISMRWPYKLYTYATDHELREGLWHIVGNLPLSKQEEKASLRLVADEVWLGDQLVRRATDRDRKTLPHMSPGGSIAVEYEIQCALDRLRSGSVRDCAQVAHLHGCLYLYRKQNPKRAIEFFNLALQNDSQLAVAYWDRAKAYAALGKQEHAEADKQRALSLDPSLHDDT